MIASNLLRRLPAPFRWSFTAACPGIPILTVAGYVVVNAFVVNWSYAWQWYGTVALNLLLQLIAITALVLHYVLPRVVHLSFDGNRRASPIRTPWLVYLGLAPAIAAAIGLAFEEGNVPPGFYLLGSAALILTVPALVDALLRGRRARGSGYWDPVGSGPAGELARLDDFDLNIPAGWCPVVYDADPGWEHLSAGLVTEDEPTRAELAGNLKGLQDDLDPAAHAATWAWALQAGLPNLAGTMTLDRITPPEGRRIDRDHAFTFTRDVEDVQLPAGPAVVLTEIIAFPARPWSLTNNQLAVNVVWAVFPTGCREALRLFFRSPVTELVVELEADARAAAESLTVDLGRVASP